MFKLKKQGFGVLCMAVKMRGWCGKALDGVLPGLPLQSSLFLTVSQGLCLCVL